MFNFPDIYDQQKRNRRMTVLIMALFILFFGFLGYGFDLYYLGSDPLGVLGEATGGFPLGTVLALLVAGGSSALGLAKGAQAVLSSAHAYPIPENDPKFKVLQDVVEEVSIAAGIPTPRIYIIPDADPNALATGKDPEHSYIAVTEGLLATVNRDELQGVVAHEISHVKNYDIRLITIIAVLVGAIFLLSDWGGRAMRFGFGGGSRKRIRLSGNLGALALVIFAVWLIALILSPIISQVLAMAVSRQREYLADASGAELTRNPLALAGALEKLDSASAPTASIKKGSANLCIVDPLGRKMNAKEGKLADLFGTHPPISKRITYLKAMAYQIHPTTA